MRIAILGLLLHAAALSGRGGGRRAVLRRLRASIHVESGGCRRARRRFRGDLDARSSTCRSRSGPTPSCPRRSPCSVSRSSGDRLGGPRVVLGGAAPGSPGVAAGRLLDRRPAGTDLGPGAGDGRGAGLCDREPDGTGRRIRPANDGRTTARRDSSRVYAWRRQGRDSGPRGGSAAEARRILAQRLDREWPIRPVVRWCSSARAPGLFFDLAGRCPTAASPRSGSSAPPAPRRSRWRGSFARADGRAVRRFELGPDAGGAVARRAPAGDCGDRRGAGPPPRRLAQSRLQISWSGPSGLNGAPLGPPRSRRRPPRRWQSGVPALDLLRRRRGRAVVAPRRGHRPVKARVGLRRIDLDGRPRGAETLLAEGCLEAPIAVTEDGEPAGALVGELPAGRQPFSPRPGAAPGRFRSELGRAARDGRPYDSCRLRRRDVVHPGRLLGQRAQLVGDRQRVARRRGGQLLELRRHRVLRQDLRPTRWWWISSGWMVPS